jgi:hypothetical protein
LLHITLVAEQNKIKYKKSIEKILFSNVLTPVVGLI